MRGGGNEEDSFACCNTYPWITRHSSSGVIRADNQKSEIPPSAPLYLQTNLPARQKEQLSHF